MLRSDLLRDLDWVFDAPKSGKVRRYPLTNLGVDDKDNLVIEVAIAGFGPDDIEISTSGNELIIEGSVVTEDVEKGTEYFQKHISSEDFKRIIRLSDEYIGGNIDASYKNGILTIVVEKNEPEKKLIEIKAA
jgi:HSP20 family molecular chaperone IbpA